MRRPQHIQTWTCDCIGEFMQTAAFVSHSHIFWPHLGTVSFATIRIQWRSVHAMIPGSVRFISVCTEARVGMGAASRWLLEVVAAVALREDSLDRNGRLGHGGRRAGGSWLLGDCRRRSRGSKRGDLRRGKRSSTALWSRKAWRSLSKLSLVWIHRHHSHWPVRLTLLASL